jgi:ABC-type branched-subunit amino acid transport system substrate-binding protein
MAIAATATLGSWSLGAIVTTLPLRAKVRMSTPAAFVKRWKEKEKFSIEPGAYSIYGYEAAVVILEAIKAVGKKDREAIRKAVLATKNFDKGALDKWSF